MTKEARIYNAEKIASSVSGTGETEQLHVKEGDYNIFSYHIQK